METLKTFFEFAEVCERIEKESSSLIITDMVADFLKELEEEELRICPYLLMGKIFPEWMDRELGVGKSLLYNALSRASGRNETELEELLRETGDIGKVAEVAMHRRTQQTLFLGDEEKLTIVEIYKTLEKIAEASGKGSQTTKVRYLEYLFSSSSPKEARYLARLVMGEMRIKVGEGIMRDAIAKAFGKTPEEVERAYMFITDFGEVAIATKKGELDKIGITLFRPVKMMLAQISPNLEEAMKEMGTCAVEWKYDGARVQIHVGNGKVKVFSRRFEDLTKPLVDVVEEIKEVVGVEKAILDGEAVAYDRSGKPKAFQYILRRLRRKYGIEEKKEEIPIHIFLFDCLYVDGESLIDMPLKERRSKLERIVKGGKRISVATQTITGDVGVAEKVYRDALDAGHEGIMLKNLSSPYIPGRRGKHWLKHKPIMETLDLVVVGADWGKGKHAHLLSSFYLACIDENTGELLEVGKVATGPTEDELKELTNILSELIIEQKGTYVKLEPKIVFEVAYEEIQKSPNYPSGYALRFPRFVRVRDDKSPEEADNLSRVEELYRKYQ